MIHLVRYGLAAVWGSVVQRGVVVTAQMLWSEAFFDWTRGTATTVTVDVRQSDDVVGDHQAVATPYHAVNPWVFGLAVREAGLADRASATFVDFGCGKGRALVLAHEAGFRKLVGIEFSGDLVRRAEDNLERRGITAMLRHEDAADTLIPPGPCVLFLFNPFGEEVVAAVARNARARCDRSAAPLVVVYVNALHGGAFEAEGFVEQRTEKGSLLGYRVFHSNDQTGTPPA